MDILDRYLNDILPLIDVDRIVEAMIELAEIEQPSDFDAFERSALYLQQCFRSAGIASQIARSPADGRTKFQAWTAPIGYRTTRATCEIVAPRSCARVLGDRSVEPYTAVVGSGHTGLRGVEGKVAHIRDLEELPALDLAHALAFFEHYARQGIVEL